MHNFSAESKKTEFPIATQSFAARERGLIVLKVSRH